MPAAAWWLILWPLCGAVVNYVEAQAELLRGVQPSPIKENVQQVSAFI